MLKDINYYLTKDKDELKEELLKSYYSSKLTLMERVIARVLGVVGALFLALLFSEDGLIWLLIAGWEIFLLFFPNIGEKKIILNFNKFVEAFENYKKFVNKESTLELKEKFIKEAENKFTFNLNLFLSPTKIFKYVAFIPLINIFVDELHFYRFNLKNLLKDKHIKKFLVK